MRPHVCGLFSYCLHVRVQYSCIQNGNLIEIPMQCCNKYLNRLMLSRAAYNFLWFTTNMHRNQQKWDCLGNYLWFKLVFCGHAMSFVCLNSFKCHTGPILISCVLNKGTWVWIVSNFDLWINSRTFYHLKCITRSKYNKKYTSNVMKLL